MTTEFKIHTEQSTMNSEKVKESAENIYKNISGDKACRNHNIGLKVE